MSDKITFKGIDRTIKLGAVSCVSVLLPSLLQNILNHRIELSQEYLDAQVLYRSTPYVPYLTGRLLNSGFAATSIGSGKVYYNTPYARRQYVNGRLPGTSATGPLRGRMWFHRMMSSNRDALVEGVAQRMGGERR